MNVSKETIDDVVVLKASGDLTAATSGALEQMVRAELAAGGNRMVIDLSSVRYVASAGLRVFLIAAKAIGGKGRFVLAGANPSVRQVLDIAGFSGIIEIHGSVPDAVSRAATA
jgi:anti-sigma B factor antagonist